MCLIHTTLTPMFANDMQRAWSFWSTSMEYRSDTLDILWRNLEGHHQLHVSWQMWEMFAQLIRKFWFRTDNKNNSQNLNVIISFIFSYWFIFSSVFFPARMKCAQYFIKLSQFNVFDFFIFPLILKNSLSNETSLLGLLNVFLFAWFALKSS